MTSSCHEKHTSKSTINDDIQTQITHRCLRTKIGGVGRTGNQSEQFSFSPWLLLGHYNDVIMNAMASQITGATSVYSIVCAGADQRKYQSSASLDFVRGIHRWPVNSPARRASNTENVSIWWRHHATEASGFIKDLYTCYTINIETRGLLPSLSPFYVTLIKCFSSIAQSNANNSDIHPKAASWGWRNILVARPNPAQHQQQWCWCRQQAIHSDASRTHL